MQSDRRRPQPTSREDLSTVLTQLGTGETIEVDRPTLESIFGRSALGTGEDVLAAAKQLSLEHNSSFSYHEPFGRFTKLPPAGASAAAG